jgi:hypothetical protein
LKTQRQKDIYFQEANCSTAMKQQWRRSVHLHIREQHLLHGESGGYRAWLCAETTPGKMKGHPAAKKRITVSNINQFAAQCSVANRILKCATQPKLYSSNAVDYIIQTEAAYSLTI